MHALRRLSHLYALMNQTGSLGNRFQNKHISVLFSRLILVNHACIENSLRYGCLDLETWEESIVFAFSLLQTHQSNQVKSHLFPLIQNFCTSEWMIDFLDHLELEQKLFQELCFNKLLSKALHHILTELYPQMMFGREASVAVQDPSYPVYVDSSVIMGMTGGYNDSTKAFDSIEYMPCRPETTSSPIFQRWGKFYWSHLSCCSAYCSFFNLDFCWYSLHDRVPLCSHSFIVTFKVVIIVICLTREHAINCPHSSSTCSRSGLSKLSKTIESW